MSGSHEPIILPIERILMPLLISKMAKRSFLQLKENSKMPSKAKREDLET